MTIEEYENLYGNFTKAYDAMTHIRNEEKNVALFEDVLNDSETWANYLLQLKFCGRNSSVSYFVPGEALKDVLELLKKHHEKELQKAKERLEKL